MRYKRTSAAEEFVKNSNELITLLTAYHKNKKAMNIYRDVLFGGIIAKLFAEFENYVSDSIDEYVLILSGISKSDYLHQNTLGTLIKLKINHDHFKNYYASQDEKKFIKNLHEQYRSGIFSWDPSTSIRINQSDVLQKNGYPSNDNISMVYWRLGIENIFNSIGADIKRDCRLILDSLNSLRCEFVHQSISPTISAPDLKKNIRDLKEIVLSLDLVTYKHIKILLNPKIP